MLWQVTTGDGSILVAVLDTGIDQNHEDLIGKVATEVNFADSLTCRDIHGHGTHVAGIIAAHSNNETGVAGVAPDSRLMNVKVANDKGECQVTAVATGIIWAVDNGANVINISLELKAPSTELEAAIDYSWSQGAVIIAAAGNDGSELPVYPAYYEHCIAVAATRPDDTLAPLSNYGHWLDLAAPGYNIYSSLPGDDYGYKSGTSFATAYVSGLAAQLYGIMTDSNGDGRTNDEVRAVIEAGCQDIGPTGTGKGCIDAANSLANIDYR
jgi:thermitase